MSGTREAVVVHHLRKSSQYPVRQIPIDSFQDRLASNLVTCSGPQNKSRAHSDPGFRSLEVGSGTPSGLG